MHRALIRCGVERSAIGHAVRWHVSNVRDELARPGVLIVDRRLVADRDWIASLQRRDDDQIRLLWNWSSRGSQDLLWCTELSFAGVINNPTSLAQWIQASLRNAPTIEHCGSSLLEGIALPVLNRSSK
jgi:hypothetical protein